MATSNDELLKYLLSGCAAVNAGPNAREIFSEQMEHEYNNGNRQQSVFYQVMMLFQAFDLRYAHELVDGEEEQSSVLQLVNNMNAWEQMDFQSNPLMQFAYKQLLTSEKASSAAKNYKAAATTKLKTTNFLHDVRDPAEGLKRINEVCQQLPKEWTVLQLCKGHRADTTYSIYSKIRESNASIYLTLLRHARSAEYPAPICIRFVANDEQNLFRKFAQIAERFKQCITVDPEQRHSTDFKKKYWQDLNDLEATITKDLTEFKEFFFPWLCLFNGIPVAGASAGAETDFHSEIFKKVDKFCDEYLWEPLERVLLSLAALHISSLCSSEMEAISVYLAPDESQQAAVMMLLLNLQTTVPNTNVERSKSSPATATRNYPCILIVDERLDHFYWETLNVNQEFSRVGSLHLLWRLQQCYKDRISNGYLLMDIESGSCVINPDNNLANTEMRMKSFLNYWMPHWEIKCRQKLTTEEMCKEIFRRNCFVYAGHGSGLQYFNCKQLTQQQMNGVVFLFGCDSSRLRSCGLYSELTGAHRYYHAALCPAVVGTLLPGLDGNMDSIAAQILSHWIAPSSNNIMPWIEIEPRSWAKEGIIKAKSKTSQQHVATMATTVDYHMGSLCEIIARVHQRRFDGKLYNCIGYVCRGLPVWNCNVEHPPQ